jgi:hypothetical protein
MECGAAFEDPSVVAAIVIHAPTGTDEDVLLGELNASGRGSTRYLPRMFLRELPDRPFTSMLEPEQIPLFRKIGAVPRRLKDYLSITRGMECGKNDPAVTNHEEPGVVPVLSGQGVQPFRVRPQGMFVELGLEPKAKYKEPSLFTTVPKLLLRFVASHPIATVDTVGYAAFNTVYVGHVRDDRQELCYALAVLLNSPLIRWWFENAYNSTETLFPHIQKYQLDEIPVPDLDKTTQMAAELVQIGKEAVGHPNLRDKPQVLQKIADAYGVPTNSETTWITGEARAVS